MNDVVADLVDSSADGDWPEAADRERKVVLSHEELSLLLGEIDLAATRLRRWYRNVRTESTTGAPAGCPPSGHPPAAPAA